MRRNNFKMLPIAKIAGRMGIGKKHLLSYGEHIAKLDLALLEKIRPDHKAKYILVSAITPTLLGEGKTLTTIGLSMAFNRLGKRSCACIRQPSLGLLFGVKGGGTGGGRSQLLPKEDINLYFTGDAYCIGAAHNLAAAFLDNSLYRLNRLKIDRNKIYWRRLADINDRVLRRVRVGIGLAGGVCERDSGFDITPASEVMAVVSLGADIGDLRARLSRIVLAETTGGKPVTTGGLGVDQAMFELLKQAVKPNLVQTTENTPCLVHTGSFANIAHGNSSVIADRIALGFSDFVVTESGFGADCGGEKFFNIKCRASGLTPHACVLVCSVRGLKIHSGRFSERALKGRDEQLYKENLEALSQGLGNLSKQIENIKSFGIPVVVSVNRFDTDTDPEIDLIISKAIEFGACDAQQSTFWQEGSNGGIELAKSLISACNRPGDFKFLYPLDMPLKDKIETIAKRIYGASGVVYSELAQEKINSYLRHGWDNLGVCMAKTHLSLSHDSRLKGRPSGFTLPVEDARAFVGAGFISPLCGKIETMPGLPDFPDGESVSIKM